MLELFKNQEAGIRNTRKDKVDPGVEMTAEKLPETGEEMTGGLASIEELLLVVVNSAADKLAEDIKVIDVRDSVSYTDYIVVCHGQTPLQNRAIVDRILEELKQYDIISFSLQGYKNAGWVLMDYGRFVVHIFLPEEREFYQIEELFSLGRELELE